MLRRLLPRAMLLGVRMARARLFLLRQYYYDYRRFCAYSSAVFRGDTKEKLAALICMSYHSLEKGLALPSPRLGFGLGAAEALILRVRAYLDAFGPDHTARVAVSVLRKYCEFNCRCSEIPLWVSSEAESLAARVRLEPQEEGGVKELTRRSLSRWSEMGLEEFFSSRSSVRQFSAERVDVSIIKRAVQMAIKTPCVCNRQSWTVSALVDRKKIIQALEIQGGARGFHTEVPALLVIASRLSHFQSAGERNQCWIDGGMFAMSLVYALHSLGLGTCCLNWSKNEDSDRAFRGVFDIHPADNILMLVAVGHVPERFLVAQSPRKSLEETLIVLSCGSC